MRLNKGYRVKKLSIQEIRKKADDLRKYYGLGHGYLDVIELLEHYMTVGSRFAFHIVSDKEMNGNAGLSWPQNHYMEIAESIYENAEDGDPESRKIIAHEVGHINLCHAIPLAWSISETMVHGPLEDSEIQADYYAFELLMPVEGVRECKSMREVSEKFIVEHQVAMDRWHALKIEGLI